MAIVNGRLSRAFSEMANSQQADVIAMQLSGFQYKEIAEHLGLSLKDVKKLGRQAQLSDGALRKHVRDRFSDGLDLGLAIEVPEHQLLLCDDLNSEERIVLSGMLDGKSLSETADTLGVGELIMRDRILNGIDDKLGARSMQEAALVFAAYEIFHGRLDAPNTSVNITQSEEPNV